MAEKLHVGAVVEGTVRRAGERLRITAQLVNVSEGYQVWSERYDRELDDVLDEFGAEIHVVAHTPVRSIQSRYGGKLLAVDLERPATEMLLLVWDAGGGRYQRWRVGLDAPPEPF